MRNVLFEFEDLPFFPDAIRQSMTDYLRYFLDVTGFYTPTAQMIAEELRQGGANLCVDLCSGGGGGIPSVARRLRAEMGSDFRFVLTDKFPNLEAFRFLKNRYDGIDYIAQPVDAANVPAGIKGVRTIYSAIHHFKPDGVKAVLQDAVNSRSPIFIFDGGDRNIITIIGIVLFHPIAFLLCTPFFRPFRFSRLLFTYVIPVIPFCTVWDGVVSILRLYSPEALLALTADVNGSYQWRRGKLKNRMGMHITYLSGVPVARPAASTRP